MKPKDGSCCLCGAKCDGSFMRIDPRYDRVREMLTAPEVPRFSGGGIALCHWCQRNCYWDGDFLNTLIKRLSSAAKFGILNRNAGGNKTYNIRNQTWDYIIEKSLEGKSTSSIAKSLGISTSTIYDVLRKNGILTATQARKKSRRLKFLKGFGVERADRVSDMRRGGQSWETIAACMGCKREEVMAAHIYNGGEL